MKGMAFLPLLLLATGLAAAKDKKPNLLLIVSDDLGYSDLGCFGGEIDTPHLNGLAAEGVRFTRFYNTGRCCPSRAALLAGRYPHAVGLGHMTQDVGLPGYRGRLSPEALTLAQVLKPAGYRSFLSGKWHLGTDDPTEHGFEEFYGTLVSAKRFWDSDHFLRLPEGRERRSYRPGRFHGTDALGDHALDFLGQARRTPERPWFLYLAFNAPHFPLHAYPKDVEKYADRYHAGWDALRENRLARMKRLGLVSPNTKLTPRSPWWNYGETETGDNPAWDSLPAERRADLARRMAIYAAMVDQMDRNVGRIVKNLKQAGELENTFILFTSDNGACAEWDPRGFDGKSSNHNVLYRGPALAKMGLAGTFHSVGSGWANAGNTPWRLYKHFNHEGGIASPGIVHWPKGVPVERKNAVEREPAHLIDVLPTFAELAGVDSPYVQASPGRSLLPLLRGDDAPERSLFFEHEGHRALRRGKWKLVALAGRPWELYDLSKDEAEMNDLAAKHPERVKKTSQAWEDWAKRNHVTPMPRDYRVGYLKPRP